MNERLKLAGFTAVSMLVLAGVVTGLSASLLQIAVEFDIAPSRAGILYTLHFAGFMGFIAMSLALRGLKSRLLLVVVFAGVYAAALVLAGIAPVFPLVALALILAGGSGGILESHTTTLQVMTSGSEAEAGRLVSIAQAFFALGALLAPVYLSLENFIGANWRTLFLTLSGLSAVAFAAGLTIKPSRFAHIHGSAGSLRWRPLIRICSAMALYVGAEVSIFGWAPTVMELYHGIPAARARLAPTLFWLGILGGRILTAWLTTHFSAGALLRFFSLLGVGASILLVAAGTEPLLWLGVAAASVGCAGIWPLIIATSGDSGHETGTTITVAAGGLGATVFPYLAGRIAEFLPGPFILSMAAPLLLGVFLLSRVKAASPPTEAVTN